jgi:hypothetical protein
MAIQVTEKSSDYRQIPPGAHDALITGVVELGQRLTDFGCRNELCFIFRNAGGETISRTMAAIAASQSELGKLAQAGGFNPKEPEQALGKTVRILVESYTPAGSQFDRARVAKFGTATRDLPTDGIELTTYDGETRDPLMFARLQGWQQDRITKAGIAPASTTDEWGDLPTVTAADGEVWL